MDHYAEANNFSANQKFPRIFVNPYVRYLIYKNLALVPLLNQTNPFQMFPSNSVKMKGT
jgi:hypothetical protein